LYRNPNLKPEVLRILLDFNLDRDRLEQELRKFSCVSFFDGKPSFHEQNYATLASVFGKAFNHKLL
jgi:hypothetical protein